MTELKIDLLSFTERFADGSREFILFKKTNFIFGKNGTGKTTIANAIGSQCSVNFNVCVFKDFNGVVEDNERLNTVALGTENAEI